MWIAITAIVVISLGINALLARNETKLDPATADYARSSCRTFYDLGVTFGATEDPDEFGAQAAQNALEEGRITESELEAFAAACADGAAAAQADERN